MSQLSTEKQQVLYLIKTDADQARYFFARARSLEYFYPLKDQDYFKPETVPYDSEGHALFWNVLDYLERVSEQVAQSPQYGKDLIEIIENVVQFSQNKKRINNYHIWWYCVKILNNIPFNIIKENLSIEKFQTWLTVWTGHSMGSGLAISDIGEKLLPKFLKDDAVIDNKYEYAETIIDVITEIKASGRLDAFSKRDDVVMAWDSYWIQDTFHKNYQLIGQKCSVDVIYGFADKLKRALEYKQKYYHESIEIDSDVYQIKVSRVPVEGLRTGEIGFIDNQYECIVKKFSQEQLNKTDRQTDFWALHNTEPQIELNHFAFNAPEREPFVSKIKANLPEDINWAAADKFEKQLRDIYDGLSSDYSYIWLKSLAGGDSEHTIEAAEVLTIVLRNVLLAKCEANRIESRQVLDAFLSDRYSFPIFRRIVLLCADKFWADYSEFLDRFLDLVPNALEEADYEVELQDVLHRHNSEFSVVLKGRLKGLISTVPEYYIEKGEKLIAYWKYKWLSPLRDNPDFSALYEEAKQKAEPKDGKPYEPELSTISWGLVSHKSPISKEDIMKKPIAELVKYLREFKGADFWHGTFEGEPDIEGLADVLEAAVKEDPNKFTDEIEAFHSVDYFYLHRVFRGLKEAWNTGKELNWEKVFNFNLIFFGRDVASILREALQAQGEDSGKGKYIWIVEDIVDLIADGCRNDARAFDPIYFDKAEQIFGLVLPLLKGEKKPDTQRDALTYALNTTLGRTIMAYVSFSLRVARATQKKHENWGIQKYERFFEKGIDAHIWFGRFLPQMKYLDKKYTEKKIEFFAKMDSSDFEWQMFMEGYLTGAGVYQDLYPLMRLNYLNGLGSKVFEERVDKRLVQHICIGYLQNAELLQPKNSDGQDSLFWKMLVEAGALGKRARWLEVTVFFWSLTGRTIKKEDKEGEEETSAENKKKILDFWAWTYAEQELVKTNLGDEYNSFLGHLAELTILLDKIDEETEKWLLLCAPHIDRHHNATFFIEYLTKFDDEESIRRIGKIFLKVLENTTPTFRQENIELIVRRIYDKGDPNDFESICNTYGRRGVHFLKPVWDEYQKNKNA